MKLCFSNLWWEKNSYWAGIWLFQNFHWKYIIFSNKCACTMFLFHKNFNLLLIVSFLSFLSKFRFTAFHKYHTLLERNYYCLSLFYYIYTYIYMYIHVNIFISKIFSNCLKISYNLWRFSRIEYIIHILFYKATQWFFMCWIYY